MRFASGNFKRRVAAFMLAAGIITASSGLAGAEEWIAAQSGLPETPAPVPPPDLPSERALRRAQQKSGLLSGLALSAGKRLDNLDWNIAGNTSGTNPNILSELTWRNIEIFQIKGALKTQLHRNAYLRGYLDYGWIYDGENQDSDYGGDNRTAEFSRSNNNAGDGSAWDGSIGIGFNNLIETRGLDHFDIAPVAGYSYHKQNLVITDGFQTIPPSGPFAGLDSSYDASWKGPFIGVDMVFEQGRLALFGTFEYHIAAYRAEADWNLRDDFEHPKSFEHTADGTGIILSGGGDYAINQSLSINGSVEFQSWEASDGTDTTFFTDGIISDTKLNEVNRDSTAVMVGLRFIF